ncbi:uncharacterized protein LOC6494624 [Drosophila ananassae]|uniref:uncharacterized protein LOC6494624 n=1 Tax=Drosophila ananassae TaxID=7217 RepID=UPI0013A5EA1B|nr:uncharacterized protein LOC6494624 [Drosophila ananassae]
MTTMKLSDFAKGLETFSHCMHDHLNHLNPDQNLIFSPLSIRMAVGMLRMGADPESATALELDQGLQFGESSVSQTADNFEAVMKAFDPCQILKMANRLYIMEGQTIAAEFERVLGEKFHSTPVSIDFTSGTAERTINSWVETQTNNKIKKLIERGSLGADSRLVLINAIHFKGEWSIRFDEKMTQEDKFYPTSGTAVKISMMNQLEKYAFAELPDLEATALKMNYSACNLSMIIILPNQNSDLATLEGKLSGMSLETIVSAMSVVKVAVKIPKFKAEFSQELAGVFKMMGMKRIFSEAAEFGRMLDPPTELTVSKIIHKAFIEVNELGTEAAAATAVVLMVRSLPAPEPHQVFIANRPFFYAICDNTHGFLFVGHFTSPPGPSSHKCGKCDTETSCKKCETCTKCKTKPSKSPDETAYQSDLVNAFRGACWLLFLLIPLLAPVHASPPAPIMADAAKQEFARRLALFSINVYGKLASLKPGENLVFSPFSIQTCAAMARLGAEGETAAQLDQGLGLASGNAEQIAKSFNQVLATYQDSQILRIANKIFVMDGYSLAPQFDQLLSKEFLSAAQNVNFASSAQAAATINGWVEERTDHLIKDLIPASALNADSRLVLVNAIHFKGSWVHQFPKYATRPDTFHLDNERSIQVPMMSVKERFGYADLPSLNAAALELPYKDSDLSMLIILPHSKTGLPALEEKLRSTPLSVITQALHKTQVQVKLPKFKAEFQVELTEVFRKLGMSRMFTNDAEFDKMLETPEPLRVSAIIHKAFIDVNEEGTEAAAATGAVVRMKRSIMSLEEPIEFLADHPFTYVLVHQEEIPMFWGSVLRLEETASDPSEHEEL